MSVSQRQDLNLTEPAFIQRLEGLYILARKVLGGSLQADRRSSKKGAGITFSDYAEYNHGDDHRAIDWRVYARLGSLVIKLFEMEEDATIAIVLDTSASMERSWNLAREMAAAIAYIGLHNLDRLCCFTMGEKLEVLTHPCQGRGQILTILRALERTRLSAGEVDFAASIRSLQTRLKRKSVVLVVSDFFHQHGVNDGLDRLRWAGHDVFCLQVQDPIDQQCDWRGDVDFVCVESARQRRLTISEREARAFSAAVQKWNEDIKHSCALRGIGYAFADTQMPFDEVIKRILRRGGLVA